MKSCRENLKQDEVLLIIDFSENYECKYNQEIQSSHFGASKKQITLHTAVLYYKENQDVKCLSFATVSESLRHDASVVWAHLCAILDEVQKILPDVKSIHFQSDGPTTQYRNKTNFYLFSHFANALGFKKASWNFSEAGHGKGPSDGIGAVVKRYADQAVAHGADIVNVDEFLNVMNKSNIKVKILKVHSAEFVKMDEIVPDSLKAIKNTMLLHQLVWEENNSHQLRLYILSCFDCEDKPCLHFMAEPNKWTTRDAKQTKDRLDVGQWVAAIYDDQWFPGM